jgi:hypothetical protein
MDKFLAELPKQPHQIAADYQRTFDSAKHIAKDQTGAHPVPPFVRCAYRGAVAKR